MGNMANEMKKRAIAPTNVGVSDKVVGTIDRGEVEILNLTMKSILDQNRAEMEASENSARGKYWP